MYFLSGIRRFPANSKLFEMKKLLICCLALLTITATFGQPKTRNLRTVSFTGRGYELGLQHGQTLQKEIGEILKAWKRNTTDVLDQDADVVLDEFFKYADFTEAIQTWTPDLYQEVKGIAEGSNQKLEDILVLNLLDEFWVFVNNLHNHHCSGVGVPARDGQPGYISQNMDLENYTDGFQVLMQLNRTETSPEQLILTHPGLIALNGLNEKGIGVCVNTLMQLKAAAQGVPVAFIVRRIINSTDEEDLLSFIQKVPHASGQNYLIGIQGAIYDFEASANQVVRFDPKNENGTIYHTNHPLVNDDIKPWFQDFDPTIEEARKPTHSNSHLRLEAIKKRMVSDERVGEPLIKEALRSKDNDQHPVCRANLENGLGFTFASIIMTLSDQPKIQILAGPPDESEYVSVTFSN